jgi:hypothetical protein
MPGDQLADSGETVTGLIVPLAPARQVFRTGVDELGRLPVNSLTAFEVETDVFVGRVTVMLRDLPSTPAKLFAGKKRQTWLVMQVGVRF